MRGKVDYEDVEYLTSRITPAYAGKRERGFLRTQRIRDHPCVCGEKLFCLVLLLGIMGSPLRMRGKGRRSYAKSRRDRITPAYAGKSMSK